MKKAVRYSIGFKQKVLQDPEQNIVKLCHKYKIDRTTYYEWQKKLSGKVSKTADQVVSKPSKPILRIQARKHSIEFRHKLLELVSEGHSISAVCRALKINRSTYYKWHHRLNGNLGLSNNKPGSRERIDQRVIKIIFDIVRVYPQWSIDQIYQYIHQESPEQLISRGAIQKILKRNNLSTVNRRLAFSYLHTPSVTTTVPDITTTENIVPVDQQIIRSRGDPSPPVYSASNLFNKRHQSGSLYIAAIIVSAIANAYLLSKVILSISQTSGILNKIGMGLASIALFCGIFFFLYSLKYYITIATVIYKSQNKVRNKGILSTLLNKFSSSRQNIDPVTLQKQVMAAELTEYPFFSVQIPLYNEKKVANRVTAAAAAMDYPNFEVLVCDDSTDETTQLLYGRWSGSDKVKILHRVNRTGFKGAALDNALKYMDPRTEYVVIFDADFVPYPDTLQLFAKYFKVIAENERNNTINPGMAAANQVVKDIQAAQYQGKTVAVQGYQWHVLNKSENWITRAVRSEFAGSYIIERSGGQVFGLLKQIAGSVYAINAKVLREVGWGTSITEDFQLTLKLYQQGYKVAYTPYIQAPSECVSTLKRLIRQRQRWAEGHSYNIKRQIIALITSPNMSLREKWEAIYLTPYYLQAFIFILGTFCWVIAETVLQVRLPFWGSALGWSLVLTNLFSLPLMNTVGLFLEEGEERDYLGLFSFITLCYVLAPFIGFAALKGFLEKEEGPWFRTPKSGHITDKINRTDNNSSRILKYLPWIKPAMDTFNRRITAKISPAVSPYLNYATAGNSFSNFSVPNKRSRIMKRGMHTIIVLAFMVTIAANIAQTTIPQAFANPDTFYIRTTTADNLDDTTNNKRLQGSVSIGSSTTTQTLSATNPTLYIITDNFNKRWTNDIQVPDTSNQERRNVQIATDSDGSTVAVWEDLRNNSSTHQNRFDTTGAMSTGRYAAPVVPLLDGRVVIAGGQTSGPSNLSGGEIFDPVSQTFTTVSNNMVNTRYMGVGSLLDDGRAMFISGANGATAYSTTTIFDPNTNTFSAGPNMSAAKYSAPVEKLYNGKLLVMGGCTAVDAASGACSSGYLSSVELFDPATSTWTSTGNMSVARSFAQSTLLPNGEVLIAGGSNGSTYHSSTEIYNPVTGTWRKVPGMVQGRYLAAMAQISDTEVMVVGGADGTSDFSSTEIFDIVANTWRSNGNINSTNRGGFLADSFIKLPNGKILLAGAYRTQDASNPVSTALLYDPIANTWASTGNNLTLSNALFNMALLPDGKVVIPGGMTTGTSATTASHIYTPNSYDIYAQKIDRNGNKLWGSGTDIRVNSDDGNRYSSGGPLYNHLNPHVALDSSGNAIVAWEEQRDGATRSSIWTQKLQSSDGTKLWPDGTDNTLTSTGALSISRLSTSSGADAKSNALQNGKVLVTGGSSAASQTQVELYDPASGTFTLGPATTYTHQQHATTELFNGNILVTGSRVDTVAGSSSSAEIYNPLTNTVSAASPMVSQRYNHTATTLKNGKVLIVGSESSATGMTTSEIFDPSTSTFSTGPSTQYPRYGHASVLIPNGKVMVIGAAANNSGRSIAEIYDPQTNTFSAVSNPSMSMQFPSAVVMKNGKVLALGTNTSTASVAEIYDPAANSWTRTGLTVMGTSTYGSLVNLPNGKIAMFGGGASVNNETISQIYDPAVNTWSAGPTLNNNRYWTQLQYLPLENKVLLTNASSNGTSAELFTPASDMPVSAYNYKNSVVTENADMNTSLGIFFKKPKLAVDSNGDTIIVWQENKNELAQFQGLAHNYDANAYLLYGKTPAASGKHSTGLGSGATPVLLSPAVEIVGQKICSRSSGCDTGTTSGERQWGNDQSIKNVNSPEEIYISATRNAQNVNIISDTTNTIITYDSDSPSATDMSSGGRPNTKNKKVYAQKLDQNGNTLLSNPWVQNNSLLLTDRSNPLVTLLNDGNVLIAGSSTAAAGSSAETYDPLTGISTATGNNLRASRGLASANLLSSGKVIIAGGSFNSTAELYDPSLRTFSATTGNMRSMRAETIGTLLKNGKVLYAGGDTSSSGYASSAEVYDPATNTFTLVSSLTRGVRYAHRAVLLPNGKVLVTGGSNASGTLSTAEIYDALANTWTSAGNMFFPRNRFTLTPLRDGRAIAIGGFTDATTRTSTAEIYDPLTNTWTLTGSLVGGIRARHSAVALPNGKVLVIAGTSLSSAEIFDPVAETFTLAGNLADQRFAHDSVVLADGRVFVTGDGPNSSAELYSIDQAVTKSIATQTTNIAATTSNKRQRQQAAPTGPHLLTPRLQITDMQFITVQLKII